MDRDKDYATARDKLIPRAEEFADKKCRKKFPGGNQKAKEAWTARWNLAYHSQMEKLWKEKTHGSPQT